MTHHCLLYELPQEILDEIFTRMSSKTRAGICSVDRKFHELSVRISAKLSKYPSAYITGEMTNEMITDVSPDYHLIVRLKNKQLVNLLYTCQGGNLDVVAMMISHGANDWNYGLYVACVGGNLDIVTMMISHGANNWNWGLLGACMGGNLDVVAMMISKGATKCLCGKSIQAHIEN